MRLSIILLFVLAGSLHVNRAGVMYISQLNGHTAYKRLKVYGEKLYIDNDFSTFSFDQRGVIEYSEDGLFLSVDSLGRLVLDHFPHAGFSIKPVYRARVLSYRNRNIFQLCADGSVSFSSNCRGATPVQISYKSVGQLI